MLTTGSSVTSPVSPVGLGGDEHLEEVGAEVVGQLGGTWPERRSVLARQHRDGDDTGPGQRGTAERR